MHNIDDLLQVSMRGKVDLPPNDVYDLLIHPENHKIFRGIEVRCHCICWADILHGHGPQFAFAVLGKLVHVHAIALPFHWILR